MKNKQILTLDDLEMLREKGVGGIRDLENSKR